MFPEGKKCKLKTCEDITETTKWESFIFDDNNFKCVVDNNKCKISSCIHLTGNCESFIPTNPSFYCKELNGSCELIMKECEEMPYDLCDQWNEELLKTIDFNPIKKCVQGKDKCELEDIEDDRGVFGFFLYPDKNFILLLVILLVLFLIARQLVEG